MRPTWPLLALTLLQGLSAGMLCLAAAALLTPGMMDIPRSTLFVWQGAAWVAGALGGMASFFHMHRLAAARYVLRRLGSSWLSREALSTAVYMIAASFVLLVHLFWPRDLGVWEAVSGLAALLGLAAVYITAMLYATIPAMRSWHSPMTVLVFVCAGLLSGGAADYALAAGRSSNPALRAVVMALAAVFGILFSFQARLFRQAAGGVLSATGTGLSGRPYRLQDSGTSRRPYRTQTQIWPELPALLRRWLYASVFALAVAIPWAAAIWWPDLAGGIWLLASVGMGVGLSRWLFFGDATHSSRVWFADQPKTPSLVRREGKRAYKMQ